MHEIARVQTRALTYSLPLYVNPEHSGKIFKTIWELKKKGRAEATLRAFLRS
jgi:hypothetical protein